MGQVTRFQKSTVVVVKGNVMAHSLPDLFLLDPRHTLVLVVGERALLVAAQAGVEEENTLEDFVHPTRILKT